MICRAVVNLPTPPAVIAISERSDIISNFFYQIPHSEYRLKIFFAKSRTRETVSKNFLSNPALGISSQDFFCQISYAGNHLKNFLSNPALGISSQDFFCQISYVRNRLKIFFIKFELSDYISRQFLEVRKLVKHLTSTFSNLVNRFSESDKIIEARKV